MTKKSLVKLMLAVFSLVLFSNVAATAQKKTDCTKTTDADIVKAIYDKMKQKPKYDSQIMHVNVRSKDGVVTLEGWATTEKIKMEIEKIARKIKCVKNVVNELGTSAGIGCGPGQKKCGAICIAQEETCNICTTRTCL
jgi:osmotically-inducible protein OsmY